jgi:DNA-binding NtrC family response regulator
MQRSIRMLVADDSHLIQNVFYDIARASKLPLRISSTDNGQDCLTLLSGGNVDLAFIDVEMPDLAGTEAFWAARKQGIQTFVTLMSTPPSPEAVDMAVKLQAYEFLFKPFAPSEVAAIIRTYARISAPTRLLIVDDSATVRQIVQRVAQGSLFQCEITEAGDGQTALMLARTSEFDVAFVDSNMPGIDGVSTMKQLLHIIPSLKVVMFSGERNSSKEMAALDAGACAFLHKPFYSQDIDRVLHIAFGLRPRALKVNESGPDFDVAIEGGTIRLAHKKSGHVFEYLWFERPPHLRNAIVRPAASCAVAPRQVAPEAEKIALMQLTSAQLLAA